METERSLLKKIEETHDRKLKLIAELENKNAGSEEPAS